MNPAILRLLRMHATSRLRRVRAAFATPRRMMLTLAAFALGIIWLGQTIASVLLREPYNPESFRRWTSLVLLLYFGWHIVRVAYKKPEEAIEWSAAEAEQIVGGPFTRRDVLAYRFLVILTSTLPKALLTAFVLLPDLWWTGLAGIVLALVFLECFRLVIDIAVCCLPERTYLLARTFVFGALLAASACVGVSIETHPGATSSGFSTHARWMGDAAVTAVAIRDSRPMAIVERPFVALADIIAAKQLDVALLTNLSVALVMIGGLLVSIVHLDRWHESLKQRRQWALFDGQAEADQSGAGRGSQAVPLPVVPRLGAIGPIVWRQWKSADRYRGSLLVALGIPAVLSCLPLFSLRDSTIAFLALVATVVFYSFVLLPEAIKFDFRLDCDHLTQLKLLPIAPYRVVLGQLAVPVLVATLFQMTLFLFAGVVRPVSPVLIGAALLLTVPINALFVALDNLIFLLYPHRPTQEGFEAFTRTILKFTFKSLLLGVAGGVLLFWALASRSLVDAGGVPHLVQIVFVGGITLAAWMSAALAFAVVTRTFDRFDVSFSVPS